MTRTAEKKNSFLNAWKESFSGKSFRINFTLTIVLLVILLTLLSKYLEFNELRNGIVIDDPYLKLIAPVNLTWLIFGMIYSGLLISIVSLIGYPKYFLILLQSYALMVTVRIIAMYSIPLNPPHGMIALNDPFVQFFGNGKILEKDLFFSGHTSTMFLLFLSAKNKILRYLFLTFTVLVGLSVLIQHVHYTVDVLVAPFIAYGCYRIVLLLNSKISDK